MADRSKAEPPAAAATIEDLAEVLIRVASGDLEARAPRTGSGDPLDVLAFMINATVEELGYLVDELRHERDELRQAQEQLVHAARLSALGQLAGGVAHELNQPLTAIRMLVGPGRARMRAGGPGLGLDELDMLSEAARRMGSIVDGVRTFARQETTGSGSFRADAPVRDALRLLEPSLRWDGISVEAELPEDPPVIPGNADRLQQVLVNLVANARDALLGMRRDPPGRVLLECRVDEAAAVYTVEDDGRGVPDEIRGRIFDPFFTTKEVGAGTGLGLSVSYGIVREHGGSLVHERAAGGGARFVVRLPRHDAAGS